MSFNELIKECLDNIESKIESYNDHKSIDHRKCDYIELLALLNTDELYKDNLMSRFYGEYSDHVEEDDGESKKAKNSDDNEGTLNELFAILKYRQYLFGNHYPFVISDDSIKLKEIDDIGQPHKLYIVLLCCANLKKFNKSMQYKLTEEFEEITYNSLGNFLPQFTIKRMGANADYRGKTKDKLILLANDLNVLTEGDQINNLPNTATKEKGVDLFGWYKFKDNIPNMPMLAVQCACGEDSEYKINEPENYHNYLYFRKYKIDPIIVLAVPKAVTVGENNIKHHNEVMKTNSLFFDRSRLMEFSTIDMSNIASLDSLTLADKLIEKIISVID